MPSKLRLPSFVYAMATLKNSMFAKKSAIKLISVFCQPKLERLDIFAELEFENIKLGNLN